MIYYIYIYIELLVNKEFYIKAIKSSDVNIASTLEMMKFI